jgi:RNA polymerase-binding transcription factor DksA
MENVKAQNLLCRLETARKETVLMSGNIDKEVNGFEKSCPDWIDRGRTASSYLIYDSLSKRLYQKRSAIDYLIGLLKSGWMGTCTRCKSEILTEDRIVEHLTSLCVECRRELEAMKRSN